MEVIKIVLNGKMQGIYGITDKEGVTNALLEELTKDNFSKEYIEDTIQFHLEKGLAVIPKDSKPFDWDENIHGKFF